MIRCLYRVILGAAFLFGALAQADVPDPDPLRFKESIDTFVAWDSKNTFPENAYLFVGSSSIRFWPTANAFPEKTIINRGFGGSELSDVVFFYDQVIKPYAPGKIFLYGGDNDIAHGKGAQQVFEDFLELVVMVQKDFPGTELIFISIKPSKQRWAKWPTMTDANRLVREYARENPSLEYADLATPLLDTNDSPGDFYVEDGLHLNEAGYALWRKALAPYLD